MKYFVLLFLSLTAWADNPLPVSNVHIVSLSNQLYVEWTDSPSAGIGRYRVYESQVPGHYAFEQANVPGGYVCEALPGAQACPVTVTGNGPTYFVVSDVASGPWPQGDSAVSQETEYMPENVSGAGHIDLSVVESQKRSPITKGKS